MPQDIKIGDIRNTVLRQVKLLKKSINILNQGKAIKEDEIEKYKIKNPDKTDRLKNQIKIISFGLRHISEAMNILDTYKKV